MSKASKHNWRKGIIRAIDGINKVTNAVCVILLTIQTVLIIIMVFGRYFFNKVPQGIEQCALFCMVWFALLSISLSVRDDSHVKMEVIDMIVKKPERILWFKYFGAAVTFFFAFLVLFYGKDLVILTAPMKMSAFRISTGWLYASAPVGAVCMMLNSIAFILEQTIKTNEKEAPHGN